MELIKNEIRNYLWKAKNTMQFTIDDTINVPDNLMDIERLVLVKGNVVIEETQAMVDRFQIKGSLNYQILYCGNEAETAFDSMVGKIPFVEYVNADGTDVEDYIEVHACLNDLTVTMLHSRKISVKALVGLDYQVKSTENFEALTDVKGEENAKVLSGSISMMGLQLQDKIELQIGDKVEIPSNKPNIYQVIWKSLSVTQIEIKPVERGLMITGTLNVFLIYTAEDEALPIQYFTMEVPFEKLVDAPTVNEDMISGSFLCLNQYHITVVPDEKGEDRIVELAADFTLEMKLYGTETMSLIQDAYAMDMELKLQCKDFSIQRLLLRNCAKTKVAEVVEMSPPNTILQICNVEGSVSIDETNRTPQGIMVEGVVGTQVTYLNKNGDGALSSATFDIPFSYEIEVGGISDDVTYSIIPSIHQIKGMQIDDTSMELKAEVSLDVLVFTNESAKAVLDMEQYPVDMEKKKEMPGVIGYIVKKGDSLWSIAKTYYTTVEQIKQINELETDRIGVGDKLIIVKE